MTIRQINGAVIPVSVSYSYVPMADGKTFILMSMRDISLQKKYEGERRVNDELRYTLEERERIARDLHDTVAQDLAYAVLEVKRVRKGVLNKALNDGSQLDQLNQELIRLGSVLEQSLAALRNSLYDLNFILETDFIGFVRENARQLEIHADVSVEITVRDVPGVWPTNLEVQLARMVKEALANIRKHANASHVWIDIERTSDEIRVTIRDDGKGFSPDATELGHYGIRSIRERCRLLGGEADVVSHSTGTEWRVRVPNDTNGLSSSSRPE